MKSWLEKKRKLLLPCDHFHLTFTLAHDLLPLWRYNRDHIAALLFHAVRDTVFLLMKDPQWMGGMPGLMLNLHTWSRSLARHPHIHALITGGGIDAEGNWRPARKHEHLISMEVIRPIFTAKMRDALRKSLDHGRLQLPPDMTPSQVHRLIRRATKKPWVVNRKPRYEHGKGVLIYLARYIRGGPIKDRRLISLDHETVTFRVSRRSEKERNMTLTVEEFLERVLTHVPSPGFRVVRNYGLYHHAHREKLESCRQQLGGEVDPECEEDVKEGCSSEADTSPEPPTESETCSVCGTPLRIREKIPRAPPPARLESLWERSP